jgi:hypothetical protein
MAVTFKTDQSYGVGLLPYFGVSKAHIEGAQQYGIIIDQSSPGTFLVKLPTGEVYGTIPVKGQAISLAKAGNLGPASKQAIQFQFEQAIMKAMTAMGTTAPKPEKAFMAAVPPPSGMVNKPPKAPPTAVVGNQVPLVDADALYQPVLGTSSGSVYYVVALLKDLNMACRIKNSTVSFRVEGSGLQKMKVGLADLGFKVKDDYGSVHFSISDMNLAAKTFGAVLGRLGFNNVLSAGDLKLMGSK